MKLDKAWRKCDQWIWYILLLLRYAIINSFGWNYQKWNYQKYLTILAQKFKFVLNYSFIKKSFLKVFHKSKIIFKDRKSPTNLGVSDIWKCHGKEEILRAFLQWRLTDKVAKGIVKQATIALTFKIIGTFFSI